MSIFTYFPISRRFFSSWVSQVRVWIDIGKIKLESKNTLMNDDLLNKNQANDAARDNNKVEVSINLDSEVLEQIQHLTVDPSRVIEAAIKQWLRGERNDNTDLTRTFQRNPPVPPQGEWND